MKTKLKNLSVTSVDLVDRGANPDAHVRLFKRKEAEPERDPDASLFQKFMAWLAKGFQDATTLGGEEANCWGKPGGDRGKGGADVLGQHHQGAAQGGYQ